jgi:hypothetical protein
MSDPGWRRILLSLAESEYRAPSPGLPMAIGAYVAVLLSLVAFGAWVMS